MSDESSTTEAKPDPVKRSWGWRILKGFGCGCGTLLLALFAVGLYGAWRMRQWSADSRAYIEQELARIKAAGEPMTVEELKAWHRLPDGEVELADEWSAAVAEIHAIEDAVPTAERRRLERVRGPFSLDGNDPRHALHAEIVEKSEGALKRILALAERPGRVLFEKKFADLLEMKLDDVNNVRSGARVFSQRAELAAIEGNEPRIVESVRGIVACAHTLDEAECLVERLIRNAIAGVAAHTAQRIADHGVLSDESIETIARELLDLDRGSSFRRAMVGERAVAWQTALSFAQGPGKRSDGTSGVVAIDFAAMLRGLSNLVDIADRPFAEARARVDSYEAELVELGEANFSKLLHMRTLLMMPATGTILFVEFRTRARVQIARVGLRAIVHRRRTGRWIQSVDELDWPPDEPTPVDPFTDQPLKIVETPEGLKVYSVGDNQSDDGGLDPKEDGKPDVAAVFRFAEPSPEASLSEP